MPSEYTCHTDNMGPATRRTEYRYWRTETDGAPVEPFLETIKTHWNETACGHITSDIDASCDGCMHKGPH